MFDTISLACLMYIPHPSDDQCYLLFSRYTIPFQYLGRVLPSIPTECLTHMPQKENRREPGTNRRPPPSTQKIIFGLRAMTTWA